MTEEEFYQKSADQFVEEYQQKLKQFRNIQFDSSIPSRNMTTMMDSNKPNSTINPTNIPTAPLKSGFQASLQQLENQFLDQYKELQVVQNKLEEVKNELSLAYKIKTTVESFKQLISLSKDTKQSLEDGFLEQKLFLEKELEKRKQDIKLEINNFESVKTDMFLKEENKLNSLRSDFDESIMSNYETFQFQLIHERKLFDQKQSDLKERFFSFEEKFDDLLKDKQNEYDSKFNDQQRSFLEAEMCLNYANNFLLNSFDQLTQKYINEYDVKKSDLTQSIIDYTHQLDQKRQYWESEKINISEEIEQERYQWELDKKQYLFDLQKEKEAIEVMKKNEKDALALKYSELDEKTKNVLDFISEKQKNWEMNEQDLTEKKNSLEGDISLKKQQLQSFDMILQEQQQMDYFRLCQFEKDFLEKKDSMYSDLDKQRAQRSMDMENDFKRREEELDLNLKDKERVLDSLLDKRKESFEDELNSRKQKIIDQCRREQKVEFDHLLDFEKDKFKSSLREKDNEKESLEETFKQKEINLNASITQQQDHIKELKLEIDKLKTMLGEVEDKTRQKVIGNSEQKYRDILDSYRKKSEIELRKTKDACVRLERAVQQRDLDLKNSQLTVKRLESQLNQYMMTQMSNTSKSSDSSQAKIVRSQKFPSRGF